MEEAETSWKERTGALEHEKLTLDVEIARQQWLEMKSRLRLEWAKVWLGIAGLVLAAGSLLKALGILEVGD